jgi:hypothetical protein
MREASSIGYCGYACHVCPGRCPCKTSPDNGDPHCPIRACCREHGLAGCWDCDDFPCGRGAFAGEDYGGLAKAGAICVMEDGLAGYLRLAEANLASDFSLYKGMSADEVLAVLRGETARKGEQVTG